MTTKRAAPSTDFRRQAILQIPPRAPRASFGDLPEDRRGISNPPAAAAPAGLPGAGRAVALTSGTFLRRSHRAPPYSR